MWFAPDAVELNDLDRAQAIADSMGITVDQLLIRLEEAVIKERSRGYKDPTTEAALANLEE